MVTVTPSRRDHLPGLSPSYRSHIGPAATTWTDIFRDTSLPSLGLHSGLAIIGYAAAQSADRTEVKDWLWPSGQVINASSSATGSPMFQRVVDFSTAWDHLTTPGRILLLGVTAWGVPLLYRIASRSSARGQRDPRYVEARKQLGFWNDAFFSLLLAGGSHAGNHHFAVHCAIQRLRTTRESADQVFIEMEHGVLYSIQSRTFTSGCYLGAC